MNTDVSLLFAEHDLRDTEPRRLVVKALLRLGKPCTEQDVHAWLQRHEKPVNLVTIYRILEKFENLDIVHRHPSTGGVTLCYLPHKTGYHGLLSCQECGHVEEFANENLCRLEDRIAKRAGFQPQHHVSEIVGLCANCQ